MEIPIGTPWGGSYRSWTTLPRLFEIILCAFPEREMERRDKPSNDRHPVLVVGILRFAALKCWALDVIMGTSNNLKVGQRGQIDLIIHDINVARTMGLHKPTRFDLERRVAIPWCTDFFEQHRPFGRLSLEYQAALERRLRIADKTSFQPIPTRLN